MIESCIPSINSSQTAAPGVDAAVGTAAIATQYSLRGYLVLEDVIDRRDLDSARSALPHLAGASGTRRSDRFNRVGEIDFSKIPNLAKYSESFRRLASSPPLVEAVEALLAQPALLFRDVAIVKPALSGAAFTYHQDSEYWDIEPRALISAWIPFRDVGVQDGCLTVIEGSHRRRYPHDLIVGSGRVLPGRLTALLRKMASLSGTGDSDASGSAAMRGLKRYLLGALTRRLNFLAQLQELHARVSPEDKRNEVTLPVRAGSAILFHSMLLHSSHPNVSESERCAYIASYMGEQYTFYGVGSPEFLVARRSSQPIFKKAKLVRS